MDPQLTETPITDSTQQLSPETAALALRLREDEARLSNGEDVGDSGVLAPRKNSAQDKRDGSARALARYLFPRDEGLRHESYIEYGRLISRLRSAHRAQEALRNQPDVEENPFRSARAPGNRRVFEDLVELAPSTAVLHPTPMPVEVAPEVELRPIFDHLLSGTAAELDCREFDRGAVYSDGRIDMCKQVVGAPFIGDLTHAVAANSHVRHFLLGNNVVGDGGAQEIAKMVNGRPSDKPIETLYLAGNEFSATGAKTLAAALARDTSVTSLWLKRNPLGPQGAGYLAEMLRTNNTLEVLDLVNTAIGDQGVESIFTALRENTTLRTIYLDSNAITEHGASAIAEYFRFLRAENRVGLTGLYIGINRLGNSGAIDLADALTNYQHLSRLDLGANRIESDGLRAVLDAAVTIPELLFLGLGLYKSTSDMGELPNYFDGEGIDLLTSYLRDHDNVLVLDVKDTNLRPSGWPDLVEALDENESMLQFVYAQLGAKLPASEREGISNTLRRNVRARYGISLEEFRQSDLIRTLKHPEQVLHIDSIYRNAM